MSSITEILSTPNQSIVDYDVSKFLLGFNSTIDANLTASGADVDLLQGMLMGRIASTNLLTPCVSTATDGSQIPVGVCIVDQTIADGDTDAVTLVNKGRVAESKINFLDTETLDTLIGPTSNQRSYRDYLNDLGLELMGGTELTAVDNQ